MRTTRTHVNRSGQELFAQSYLFNVYLMRYIITVVRVRLSVYHVALWVTTSGWGVSREVTLGVYSRDPASSGSKDFIIAKRNL